MDPVHGQVKQGDFFYLNREVDYILHPETGYITFQTEIQDKEIIAVAYRVENSPNTDDDDYFRRIFIQQQYRYITKLVLKFVKPQNLQPSL